MLSASILVEGDRGRACPMARECGNFESTFQPCPQWWRPWSEGRSEALSTVGKYAKRACAVRYRASGRLRSASTQLRSTRWWMATWPGAEFDIERRTVNAHLHRRVAFRCGGAVCPSRRRRRRSCCGIVVGRWFASARGSTSRSERSATASLLALRFAKRARIAGVHCAECTINARTVSGSRSG